MFDINDWNVRIIQNGDIIEDTLYNIYDSNSIVFDENEGLFLHSDYEKALTIETDREHRTPLLPMRNYHISKHDFFSVSVSLEVYFKMLKGEKKFPNNVPSEGRKNHPIMFNSLATLTEEDKIAIQKLYREL